ncbi:MAG: pyridoxal phosphate-dependent aminotransferase, partial [Peptostreptococcaceae bacterium]
MSTNHGANLYDLSSKYGFSKEEFMDFSSNINPLGTSKLAKQHIIDNIDMVSIYPDPEYINLKKSISSYCKCSEKNIILGSGATELISSFIETINPKCALLLSPAYSEYEKELKKINCNITKYFSLKEKNFKIDVSELIHNINENNYELIIICNPNNPTGFTFSKIEIEKILQSTNAFVMVDETYIEFTDIDTYSSTSLVDNYLNLFVIRGTSKFFSTPGIRLGYGLIGNVK